MDMLNVPVRKMFLKIIEWYIGIETGFSVSSGKSGKNMQTLLPAPLYKKILLTYPDAKTENIWESIIYDDYYFQSHGK
jgi:aminoglycoside 6-adenylyltransferase